MLMSCDGIDFTPAVESSPTASSDESSLKEWCDILDHSPLPDSAPVSSHVPVLAVLLFWLLVLIFHLD